MSQFYNLPGWMKNKKIVISTISIAIVIAILTSIVFVVDQTEESVVLRFGQYHRTLGPGLHLKFPFRIEQNFNVATQIIQNMSFGFRTEQAGINTVFSQTDYPEESIMLTGDLNIVDVEWIIQYRIMDPKQWLFNVENKTKTIRDISQSVVNQLVGDLGIIDVMGNMRTTIEFEAQKQMNNLFESYGLGINVSAVRLQNIVPPEGRVQDSFEDVNRAIQDMNRLINEGREAYNKEIPKARGEADRLILVAKGYAAERINKAKGDTNRFLSVLREYNRAPSATRTRLYYEMVENVFQGKEPTELVDKNLRNFLPLLDLSRKGEKK